MPSHSEGPWSFASGARGCIRHAASRPGSAQSSRPSPCAFDRATGVAAYQLPRQFPSQRPTPYASMSAKLSPSAPAVPSLRRTRLQASARKSSRHTLSISAWKRRSGSSLAFACNTVRSRRTCSDPGRLSPVVMPFLLPVSLSNQGSFPPPALPGLTGTTSPSATLPAQPAPHGGPVGVCSPPTGLPVLLPSPSSMRAAATTPAEPASARVARFPASGSLPRDTVGSASAFARFEACSAFTRVAARMVARPPKAACSIGVLQAMSLPPSPAPIATGWSDSCRAGFAPARGGRLSTAHRIACAPAPAFAPARFARLIACARQAQGALLPSVPLGFFRTGARQETKRPPDTASFCLILSRICRSQTFSGIISNLANKIPPPEGDIGTCHEMSCSVMRCHEAPRAPGLRGPPCRRACHARREHASRPFPTCLPGSCTLRNRKGSPGSRPSSQPITASPMSSPLRGHRPIAREFEGGTVDMRFTVRPAMPAPAPRKQPLPSAARLDIRHGDGRLRFHGPVFDCVTKPRSRHRHCRWRR